MTQDGEAAQERRSRAGSEPGLPSNEVYARVGDAVLSTAREGVQRHLLAQDIIGEIRSTHGVHLNVGELRLLLASRRI